MNNSDICIIISKNKEVIMFSNFLNSKHDICKKLVDRLSSKFEYVSLLGKQITGDNVRVTTFNTSINDSMETQNGFVVKIYGGKAYSEYSFSDIDENNIDDIEKKVVETVHVLDDDSLLHISGKALEDEPLVKEFSRPMESEPYSVQEIIAKYNEYKGYIHSKSDKIIQSMLMFERYETSSMFISKNRDLKQNFSWCIAVAIAVSKKDDKIQMARDYIACNDPRGAVDGLKDKLDDLVKLAEDLLNATMIEPGVYDIITNPSITGLIAHEAFGHSVEMDMFLKKRARARKYINKPVASSLVNMHDGAAATYSCASYFFDDEGTLAQDTLIIKNGILLTGICDAVSGAQLGHKSTGNGRRESANRKAYTRMTNTFFEPGNDKLEDMIKSVKHGYMLFDTNNGMEDPKNWNIQCTAEYGREIKDGKFTGKIVAPVVMSGYVPDLLMSISMISDDFKILGSGHCGKGHKEWVTVSDGGPCLKARCKLG
ncbi:MAG: TldD/PmbA family protein [Erysipelotrichaceae bacterium]|nr:TldD/PmbA family protein [Erysipelotrichaceae bacterium]